ncbi:uncharacterized protein ACWYII_027769 [Salvelinus alpinus]
MELATRKRLARTPERQPPNFFGGKGHTGSVAESGSRPEPTPRAYRGEYGTGQNPCYGVMLTVLRWSIHRPVCSVPASRICRVEAGIQPERVVPALLSRPPVHLHGPVYPVPRPRTRPPACLPSLVSPVPAPRARPPVCLSTPVMIHGTKPPVVIHGPEPPVVIHGPEPPESPSCPGAARVALLSGSRQSRPPVREPPESPLSGARSLQW